METAADESAEGTHPYTQAQLAQLGRELSTRHRLEKKHGPNRILKGLAQDEAVLAHAHRLVCAAGGRGHDITAAGQWLLDNYYLIQDQILMVRRQLPRSYSRELPLIYQARGKFQPRVRELANQLVVKMDGQIDLECMLPFVSGYQEKATLKIGELWAFPIMLRLALIENIRRVAERVAAGFLDEVSARYWSDRLSEAATAGTSGLISEIGDLARSNPRLSSAFIAEYTRRIQSRCPSPGLCLEWLEHRLQEEGTTIQEQLLLDTQLEAHHQISIGESIQSLRRLDTIDWREFFETTSAVEGILRQDPTQVYSRMDFATRDNYRHTVEFVARHSGKEEVHVAQSAISQAENAPLDSVRRHVGYSLVGGGRSRWEKSQETSLPFFVAIDRSIRRHPLSLYLGLTLGLSTLVTAAFLIQMKELPFPSQVILGLLLLLGTSQPALTLVNWVLTLLVAPRPWSRLDFKENIPDAYATLVAVPVILNTVEGIQELVDDLEVRFLANRYSNLQFALLTDFPDSKNESDAEDESRVTTVVEKIQALNALYPEKPFCLFHRERQWNPAEGVWMGRERKRGKLEDLNDFLTGNGEEHFKIILAESNKLKATKFVIVLDADTTLPRDTAHQLIATAAHPLNQVRLDRTRRKVVGGYAILQPRVATLAPLHESSLFMRLWSDEGALDPYTRCVSDVYQDLFDEGSFIGKGIYDVEAVTVCLSNRLPENRILSHDLIEGCLTRVGLVTDLQLVEEFPAAYSVDAGRRHRWIRGDWQIATWLFPKVPNSGNKRENNPLSGLSLWKIFDNLRRSLVPPALVLILFLGWALGIGAITSLGVALFIFIPGFIVALHDAGRSIGKTAGWPLFSGLLHRLGKSAAGGLFSITLLPAEAWLSVDSIARTLFRLTVTKRRLLEWRTARDVKDTNPNGLAGVLRLVWPAPVASVAAGAGAILGFFDSWVWSYSALWIVAPFVALGFSRPILRSSKPLDQADEIFLRCLARRTWHYFEILFREEDHFLTPDNWQESPGPKIARRTSPTNIGLALLSNLSAWDLGYLSCGSLLDRTKKTFDTLDKLARFRGHFLNWYSTETLAALNPRYVSTVDSGNFAGALLTLKQGLIEIGQRSYLSQNVAHGIRDLMGILSEEVARLPFATQGGSATQPFFDALEEQIKAFDGSLAWFQLTIEKIEHFRATLQNILEGATSVEWCDTLVSQLMDHYNFLKFLQENPAAESNVQRDIENLCRRCESYLPHDYLFLYNKSNRLLSIGYNVDEDRRDPSYYDLLGSEARLASFVAIAVGAIPQDNWYALGRQVTRIQGRTVLLSWSGSMFEYLMPSLLLPSGRGTLIDESAMAAVHTQIQYGKARGVPWGISESGYYHTDTQMNYQYRAFGVPGLGFKRGLEQDLVVAPYASTLALLVDTEAALDNLRRFKERGYLGRYGLYEAIDFTSSRLSAGQKEAVVYSFMAHHQGMGLVAIAHTLLGGLMPKRLARDSRFKATELLLHERVPKELQIPIQAQHDVPEFKLEVPEDATSERVLTSPTAVNTEVGLLGNGRLHLVVTQSGGGFCGLGDLQLTRWHPDAVRDPWGQFIYYRDVKTGAVWSATFQPTRAIPKSYEVKFLEGRAEFRRLDGGIESRLDIGISADEDVEVKKIILTNRGPSERQIEITTYSEPVLATRAEDAAHPAFQNLFIQTEIIPRYSGMICHRRPRSIETPPIWLAHGFIVPAPMKEESASFETDRRQFLGRGKDVALPEAVRRGGSLSNSAGSVVDPCLAIRQRIRLPPGKSTVLHCFTAVSQSREGAIALLERMEDARSVDRILELSWTGAHHQLRQFNISEREAVLFTRMAGYLLYPSASHRSPSSLIRSNTKGVSGLWSHGLSGDFPIVLFQVESSDRLPLVTQLARAHCYWHAKGMPVEVILLVDDRNGYRRELYDSVVSAVTVAELPPVLDRRGGIFIRHTDQIPDEDRTLFAVLARLILKNQGGTLEEQIAGLKVKTLSLPRIIQKKPDLERTPSEIGKEELALTNPLGGFANEGQEYVIRLRPGETTPLPWSNVLAHPSFGTLITESGGGYTWSGNAHEHRLTPWSNDPVTDECGEAIYLRDEQDGCLWSPTPLPCRGKGTYEVRHGFGYSTFQTVEAGIQSHLSLFVASKTDLKVGLLRLTNATSRHRRISVTTYLEPVLGERRERNISGILTEFESVSGALCARNVLASEFRGTILFSALTDPHPAMTVLRREFLGQHGSLRKPLGMERVSLSGQTTSDGEPCLALQSTVTLAPKEFTEIVILTGIASDRQQVERLVHRFREPSDAARALVAVQGQWAQRLGSLKVITPESSLDPLVNGWLVYQTLSARVFGRTGFYQSGGAYGFRDQLQDLMALSPIVPTLTREHLLRSASRQFREGDVQHWWHPPSGRGVRTRCSDDLLWLPYATARYIETTGDSDVLSVPIPFLEGRDLKEGEDSVYELPIVSDSEATLYEHCRRAIHRGLTSGVHGLPLMGTGDWNDGMNRVGEKGRGESVWLGFFLFTVLKDFIPLALKQGDSNFAHQCEKEMERIRQAIDKHGWDGQWFRRGYYDSGAALGSHESAECQIDSLAQSWAVLSGAAPETRCRIALTETVNRLASSEIGLVPLLDPPFDKTPEDPGYIKAYPPGIRENGGQYTHAALWLILALVKQGDTDRAWKILSQILPTRLGMGHGGTTRYQVEPYVVAADLLASPTRAGQGGWTWYTGSSALLYRLITESFLGIERRADGFRVRPNLPSEWNGYHWNLRRAKATYEGEVVRAPQVQAGCVRITLNGTPIDGDTVPWKAEGNYRVLVEIPLSLKALGETIKEERSSPLLTDMLEYP